MFIRHGAWAVILHDTIRHRGIWFRDDDSLQTTFGRIQISMRHQLILLDGNDLIHWRAQTSHATRRDYVFVGR